MILFSLMLSLTAYADEPKTDVTSCFSDYIEKFADTDKGHELADVKKRCLTKSFLSSWQKIIQATNFDPLLLAQDFEESWKTSVNVELVGSSAAKVTLGQNSEKYCLLVGLEKSSSGFLISSSKRCLGDSAKK